MSEPASAAPLLLGLKQSDTLPAVLPAAAISGGAVYDALVGLAAKDNNVVTPSNPTVHGNASAIRSFTVRG